MNERVLVYGPYGHTGRFVVEELLRRGLTPVVAGRSAEKMTAYEPPDPGIEKCVVAVEDQRGLRRAVEGCAAVINAGRSRNRSGPSRWLLCRSRR